MPEFLSIDQLLEAVREQTTHLVVGDERIAQQLTERNVRYYVTLGVVRPPLHIRGKSMWTSDHVKDLVRVRRAQSAGQSLREIGPPPSFDFLPTWKAANVGAHRAEIFNSMSVGQYSKLAKYNPVAKYNFQRLHYDYKQNYLA